MFAKQIYRYSSNAWKSSTIIGRRLTSTTTAEKTLAEDQLNNNYYAIKLTNKSLLRVTGDGSFIYLQSLLTNDMRRLLPKIEHDETSHENLPSIYSYILSSANRVLCDLFIYRSNAHRYNTEFIIEVDKRLASAVKRLLLGYNLTRDIKVEHVRDIDLWSILPYTAFLNHSWRKNEKSNKNRQSPGLTTIDSDDLKLIADPRLGGARLGYRLLTRLESKATPRDLQKYLGDGAHLQQGHLAEYIRLKYLQGICEGHDDIRSGFFYPFELNGDFLDAIRLDKGLFTSEEKVISIYARDPIKRRILPILFNAPQEILRELSPAPSTIIKTKIKNKKFGELRARIGRHGIASLRVPMANNFDIKHLLFDSSKFPQLYHDDTGLAIEAKIPNWWPEHYDTLYLDSPDYPLCMFNFKEEPKTIEQQNYEFLKADEQPREHLVERN